MLLKVFREETLCFGISQFVGHYHGSNFQDPPAWKLEDVYPDTQSKTPIMFILSTGADPTAMLQRFAESKGWIPGEQLHMISLGQGQVFFDCVPIG
jgi:dynein heavy chain, axonemal